MQTLFVFLSSLSPKKLKPGSLFALSQDTTFIVVTEMQMKKKRRHFSIHFSILLACLLLPAKSGICQGQPILSDISKNSFSLLSEKIASSSADNVKRRKGRKLQISAGEKITFINFNNHSPLTPYIGAGMGDVEWSNNDSGPEDEMDSLTYRLGAGLGCNLSESIQLSVCYLLHFPAESAELGAEIKNDLLSLGFHKCF